MLALVLVAGYRLDEDIFEGAAGIRPLDPAEFDIFWRSSCRMPKVYDLVHDVFKMPSMDLLFRV